MPCLVFFVVRFINMFLSILCLLDRHVSKYYTCYSKVITQFVTNVADEDGSEQTPKLSFILVAKRKKMYDYTNDNNRY